MTQILRHKTAIHRGGLSRPVKLILDQGILTVDSSFFDYGCGHGEDVEGLSDRGYAASGWDPYHRPRASRTEADVVAITYVLNVIEVADQRRKALRSAWELARDCLVVTTLVTGDKPGRYLLPYADGVVTGQGTFQKYFQQDELRRFIEDSLDGVEAIPIALGVFVVFRATAAARAFEVRRFQRRLTRGFAGRTGHSDRDLGQYVDELLAFVMRRGRFPKQEELQEVRESVTALGGKTRAERFLRLKHAEEIEIAQEMREEDLLLFLALDHFKRRRTKLKDLPRGTQLDIQTFFGSHKKSKEMAKYLLFGVGEEGTIPAACRRAPVGKLMPDALYVHQSYISSLPLVLRLFEGLARVYAGSVDGATLVKLSMRKPQVSYLFYPDFDEVAHPVLKYAVITELGSLNVRFLDFSQRSNPPVLHRKDMFVGESYPGYNDFARLTVAEEEAGVFAHPNDIGTLNGWDEALAGAGLRVVGHKLKPV